MIKSTIGYVIGVGMSCAGGGLLADIAEFSYKSLLVIALLFFGGCTVTIFDPQAPTRKKKNEQTKLEKNG